MKCWDIKKQIINAMKNKSINLNTPLGHLTFGEFLKHFNLGQSILYNFLDSGIKFNITVNSDDLKNIVDYLIDYKQSNQIVPEQKTEPKMLYSIKELADFLQCSIQTAQKIKNSGRIPFSQTGRKVVFDGNAVMSALSVGVKGKRI